MRFTATLAAAALALLVGCASAPPNGFEALNAGNLPLAEKQAMAAAQRGDPTGYTNLAAVAARRGDRETSIRYHTLAARHGVPASRAALAAEGLPVPAADLAPAPAAQASSGDGLARAVDAFADGYNGGRGDTTRCITRRNSLGQLETTCR